MADTEAFELQCNSCSKKLQFKIPTNGLSKLSIEDLIDMSIIAIKNGWELRFSKPTYYYSIRPELLCDVCLLRTNNQ